MIHFQSFGFQFTNLDLYFGLDDPLYYFKTFIIFLKATVFIPL
jgi:hypothetical protein